MSPASRFTRPIQPGFEHCGRKYGRRVRILHPISEDEVVATFLRAELDSGRYGETLRAALVCDGLEPEVLRSPNLADETENRYRRRLLDEHRAYERREGLFAGFPRRVDWFRAALTGEEVLDILYIKWDWWLRVSGGSRRPRDAAERIRGGEAPGITADEGDEAIAAALQANVPPPELIAVTNPAHAPLVLVEGHIRLTAYALFPEYLPEEVEILLGVSSEIDDWSQF
jgi:hypothetical protein